MAEILFQLKLETAQFSKALQDSTTKVKPASLPIRLNTSTLDSELNKLRAKVNAGVQLKINNLVPTIKSSVTLKVDRQSGNDLAKIIAVKLEILLQLFTRNNYSGINESIKNGFKDIKIKPEGNLFSGLFDTLTAPLQSVIRGSFEGIGQGITVPLGKSISQGLEIGLSDVIGSFELVGTTIGERIADTVQDYLVASGKATEVVQQAEQFLGAKNIARVSGSDRTKREQVENRQIKQAQDAFIKDQQRVIQQLPESEATLKAIKTARTKYIEALNKAGQELAKIQAGDTAKQIIILQKKLSQGTPDLKDTNRIKELTSLSTVQQLTPDQDKEKNDLLVKVKNIKSQRLQPQDEAETVNQLNQLLTKLNKESSQIIKKVQLLQSNLDGLNAEEKILTDSISRPQKALAQLGNTTALKLENIQKQILAAKGKRDKILELLLENSIKIDKATDESEKTKYQQIFDKAKQLLVKNKQDQTTLLNTQKFLQQALSVPSSVKTPTDKANFVKTEQIKSAQIQLNKKTQQVITVERNIQAVNADRERSKKLEAQAGAPLEKAKNLSANVFELEKVFTDTDNSITEVNNQIQELTDKLIKIQSVIETIKVKEQNIVSDVQSGTITQSEGLLKLQNTSQLKDEYIAKGVAVSKDRAMLRETRSGLIEKSRSTSMALQQAVKDRNIAVEYLDTPEAIQALQAVKTYREWISKSSNLIENEVKKLREIVKEKAQLQQSLNKLEQPKLDPIESTAKQIYENIANQVNTLSGITKNINIPTLKQDKDVVGVSAGNYQRSTNTVGVSSSTIQNLQSSNVSDLTKTIILHEVRHSIQPQLEKLNIKLLKATEDELKKFGESIETSVSSAIKQNPNLSQASISKLRELEEDAYVFAERFLNKINDASIPNNSRLLELQNSILNSVKIPTNFSVPGLETEVKKVFNSSEQLKAELETYTIKQLKQLASKINLKNVGKPGLSTKSDLVKQINLLYGVTGQGREYVGNVISNAPDELAGTESSLTQRLKLNQKAIKNVLDNVTKNQSDDNDRLINNIIIKTEDQLKFINLLKENTQLSTASRRSLGGIKTQLQSTLVQAKVKKSEFENKIAKVAQANVESVKKQVETIQQSVADVPDKLAAFYDDPDELNKKIKEIEKDIQLDRDAKSIGLNLKPDIFNEIYNKSDINKKLNEIERKILEDLQIKAAGIIPGKDALPLPPTSVTADFNRLKSDTPLNFKGKLRQSLNKQITAVKNSVSKLQNDIIARLPIQLSAPVTKAQAEASALLINASSVSQNLPIQVLNPIRRAILKFNNTIGTQLQINALSTIEQTASSLSAVETGIRSVPVAKRQVDKIRNIPNYLGQRSRNAVVTKSRFIFDNSDAINTLVTDQVSRAPDAAKATNLVQTLTTQRNKLADLFEVYNRAPTTAGFAQIKTTLNDLEKTLKNLGVPLPKINKLLDDYTKRTRELQGRGIIPLDFEIPTAEKFNPIIDAFEKFGGAGSKVLTMLVSLGKGFLAFQGVNFLQNQLSGLARESFQVATRFEALQKQVENTSGSVNVGAKNFQFASDEAIRLKQPLEASVQSFSKLASTTKNTVLEGAPTQKIFTSLSQASLVQGLTPEQLKNAQVAISQISAKGVVSLEELRGQLAEALPNAIGVASRAFGITERDLYKLVETGKLTSNEFLIKFSNQLAAETSAGVTGASNTAQASINAFSNSLTLLQLELGKSVQPAVVVGINALSNSFKFLTDNIETLQAGFAILTLGLTGLSLPLLKIAAQFIALRSVALIPIGATLASTTIGLGLFATKALLLQVALQSVSDTFKQFTNVGASDMTQFADKTQQALDRIAKSAEDTKNKLSDVKQQPFVPGSQGLFDRIGRGAAGEVPFSDTLKGRTVKFLVDTSPLIQANVLVNKIVNKAKTGKFEFYSEADRIADERRIQSSQALLNVGTITGQAQKFVENRSQGKVGASARVREISNIDKQISDLSLQKEAIAIRPGKGKDQIAASTELEKQINILVKKRNEAATEYEAFVTEITTGLSSTQQALNAELEKGSQADPRVVADLQASLSLLQVTEKQLAQVRQEVGNVDATQKLADSLFNLSDAYDNASNASSKFLTQQKLVVNNTLNRTIKTDRLASQKAGLADIDTQLKATRDQITAQEKISQDTKALVGSSLNEKVFKAAGITDDTSLGDLKLTAKRTTDPKIKQAIDALIQIKTEENKINELRLQESQTLSQRQNIIEQNTVENLERSNQQIVSNATRTIDKRISEIKRYQRQGILGETTAAIEISKIQIKTAEDTVSAITKRQQELNKNRSKFSAKAFEQQSVTIQNELSTATRSLEEARLQSGNEVRASELTLVQAHAEALQSIEDSRYSQGLVNQNQYNQQTYQNTQQALDEEQKLLNKRKVQVQPGNTEDLDKLNKQQGDINKRRAESQDKYYKDEYKQLDDNLTLAEAAIKESETRRETESLRLLASGSATINQQIEIDKKRFESKKITNREEINLEVQRNKLLKLLQFNNPDDRKQNEKNISASANRIAELTNAGLQLEIDEYKRSQELKVSASLTATNQIVNNLEREKQANDVLTKSLETQVKLLQARKGLSEAKLNLQVTQSENATSLFDRALELRRKTQPEQTPAQQKQREQAGKSAAQQELNKLGLGGASELEIIDKKIAAENQLAALRLNAKQLELELDQRILDLEIERDRLTNERVLKEAIIAKRKSEQAVTEATSQLEQANRTGDPVATRAAENTLTTSQLGLQVSSDRVNEAYQQLTVEQELAKIRRDSLDVSQQATRQQVEFTEAARQSANALTRAGAAGQSLRGGKDSLKVLTIGQLYKGGEALPGTPYLVGENPDGSINRTTELFIPKTAGQVLNAETTQNIISQILRPKITLTQTSGVTQRMSAKKDVGLQTDKAVVDAIAGLHRTVRDGAFRPQVEQENSFTIVEQGSGDDTALKLHRQLLLQR